MSGVAWHIGAIAGIVVALVIACVILTAIVDYILQDEDF